MSRNHGESTSPLIPFDGAIDCHVHVFGPQSRHPYVEPRRYTPADASIEEYRVIATGLGLQRVVLTQPSVHGLDNSAMLDAVATAPQAARAVVMVPADVSDERLAWLHAAGARGVRTQLKPNGEKPLTLSELRSIAERTAHLHWHAEIHVDVSWLTDADDLFADFPVPVAIEHMGHMKTSEGIDNPGFRALLRFVEQGGWAKLSGAYINSIESAPYRDTAPFAEALIAAAPDRVVWGSNWPHPHQDPIPDDAVLLPVLKRWVGDDDRLLHRVLVDNPERLYDFPGDDAASQA